MQMRSPFDELMGTEVLEAGPDSAAVVIAVTPSLHQPGGIVHGGAYCALVEYAASLGANTWLADRGVAVGVSNHTDFIRAVRGGRLRADSKPLQRGRRLQLWEVDITDDDGKRVAHGKVRIMNVADTPE